MKLFHAVLLPRQYSLAQVFVSAYRFKRKGLITMKRKLLWILFILYLSLLLQITVLRGGLDPSRFFHGSVNLLPFIDLIHVWMTQGPVRFIYLCLGNIVWFLPFGFFLTRYSTVRPVILISAGLFVSLLIETMQFVFGSGISELDDVLLNTFGTVLGVCFAKLLKNASFHIPHFFT